MTDESDLQGKELMEFLSHGEGRKIFAETIASVLNAEIFGRTTDSYDVDRIQVLAAGITSSQYAARHMGKARREADALALLRFAAEQISVEGSVLEFGVFSGRSVNYIADLLPSKTIYGFDSFEGLPESWRPGFQKGMFAVQTVPKVQKNVELIVGWFDRTLPGFLDSTAGQNIALLHVDCDLYSSAQVIFQQLRNRIVPGTIIVFDEYYNYPGWETHEFLAFQEFVGANRVHYDYIGIVPSHQQVAVRIVG